VENRQNKITRNFNKKRNSKFNMFLATTACVGAFTQGPLSELAFAQTHIPQPTPEEQDYDIIDDPEVFQGNCDKYPSEEARDAVDVLFDPSAPHGRSFRKVAFSNRLHPVGNKWLMRRLNSAKETSAQAIVDERRYLGKLGIKLGIGTPSGHYRGFHNPGQAELKKKKLIPRLKGIANGYTYFTYEYVHDLAGQEDLYLMAQKRVKNTGQANWDSNGASQLYLNIKSSASDMPSTVGHELFHPVQKICGIDGIDEAYDELERDVQGTSLFEAKPELDRLKRAAMKAGKAGCDSVIKWKHLAEQVVSTTPYGLRDEKNEDGSAQEDQAELASNLNDPKKLGELFEYPVLKKKIKHIMARIYDSGKTGQALVKTWASSVKGPLTPPANKCDR
jgi:hypothetical protein